MQEIKEISVGVVEQVFEGMQEVKGSTHVRKLLSCKNTENAVKRGKNTKKAMKRGKIAVRLLRTKNTENAVKFVFQSLLNLIYTGSWRSGNHKKCSWRSGICS